MLPQVAEGDRDQVVPGGSVQPRRRVLRRGQQRRCAGVQQLHGGERRQPQARRDPGPSLTLALAMTLTLILTLTLTLMLTLLLTLTLTRIRTWARTLTLTH